ncbi:baseplate wedge tail fiber protein connector [Escherichia phage UFV-AREG1]|uniref:Baseplate wedge tail fiber connector n=1 Tax=Escherichia phage UFV-AREG1 TaxID=1837867 RepID=A0A173GAG7_9CAUD|nr:baseplate wedge tail fiber protein connector [Escherichia phage UFV-AREG1]ANH50292.1 baseplate wedge tail fiber connector [Escherichia phage UFV-AREG1]
MFIQEPKKLIDTGEIGNASTGDILFDGGNKINSDFNAIYNAFGDQRKMAVANGTGTDGQIIHATGYYQKHSIAEYATPVKVGTRHDIDTSTVGVKVIIERGELGDCVEFINSNGSISVTNPLTIQAIDSIKGVSGNLVVTSPYSKVTLRCISSDNSTSVWNYSIESMFGQKESPAEGTWNISTSGSVDIPLFHRTEYNMAKLLVTCQSVDGRKIKTAEINILVDTVNSEVISSEYAVMRVGNETEEDEIANIAFSIKENYVTATISSSTVGMRAAVKVIATQKIGVAQ